MNRTKIKNYAPQARRDFLQAVTDRAAFYGLAADRIDPVTVQGDVALIGGRAFPRVVADKRRTLEERVERDGFGPTMEALAYTWFNRLVAIRYMELHGYLAHGYRVLSNPDSAKATPEILDHAEHVELPDLKRERVIELKLDGTKEAELYRMLLVAQCNALHSAMPFLFERIGDETELVLPESLLHTDSIVRKLVSGIDEEDWREVEIIGWLYEAYISERYEQVIGKVVASADIPAATQRFTPKWIVRYLVQNTLGRQWMATYPQSPLAGQMKYYIEPAEQTSDVQEQLKAITPTSLNPEEITFLDPACGSAHILVEAYDLFKAIYQERGYRAKDIPRLILSKNLFGLEIDDRAAQLAAFALMMKARADDRRIFDQEIQPHVRSLIQTDDIDAEDIAAALNVSTSKETPPPGRLFETEDNLFTRAASPTTASQAIATSDVKALIELFEHAKTFGSLIQVPRALAAQLTQIEERCWDVAGRTSDIASRTAKRFVPILEQARILAGQYDCVVANPPYMNSRYFNTRLKEFVSGQYSEAKADICTVFIERAFDFAEVNGFIGEITMQNWMFLPSFEDFRVQLLGQHTIRCMAHLGPYAFPNIGGQVVQVTVFVAAPHKMMDYKGSYKRLVEGQSHEKEERFDAVQDFTASSGDFAKIPGSPVAYSVSDRLRSAFTLGTASGAAYFGQTTKTTDNPSYTRLSWEPSAYAVSDPNSFRPFAMGGKARKWQGNRDWLVRWDTQSRLFYQTSHNARTTPSHLWMKPGITWTDITAAVNTFRVLQAGDIPSTSGPAVYFDHESPFVNTCLAFLNSKVAAALLRVINPTLHVNPQDVLNLPFPRGVISTSASFAAELITASETDWNFFETSWKFQTLPVLQHEAATIARSQEYADAECLERFCLMNCTFRDLRNDEGGKA